MTPSHPPVSPSERCGGMFYFPRMLDKIRLHLAGALPQDYHANLGRAMDAWTCAFLQVDYTALRTHIGGNPELSDTDLLTWCHETGHKPSDFELFMFNQFIQSKGFRDELSERLVVRKEGSGFADRPEIQTFFDYIDADEGRI